MVKAKENFRYPCYLKFSYQRWKLGGVHLKLSRYEGLPLSPYPDLLPDVVGRNR